MSYCTKCGKQNLDTAKFCTGCGNILIAKAASASPQKDAEHEKLFGSSKKLKKNTWLIIGIIAFLGFGTGAYFIFFNKRKDPEDNKTTVATKQESPSPFVDSAAVYVPPPTTVSEPVPLSPGTQGTEVIISKAEVDYVSQALRNFYQCENDEDLSCLLSQYSFPVNRYYQLYNVSYEDLHKLFTESFNEKLNYHFIDIKWDYCTVQKNGTGYKAALYADYNFIRQNTPDEKRTRSIQVIIYMNNNYKITTIYENQ